MGAPPEPPFIANLLSYLLVVCLIYLFYYSWQLRSSLKMKSNSTRTQLPASQFAEKEYTERPAKQAKPPGKIEFIIEPSPIPGERVIYPTVANSGIEVNLSVVIPVRNASNRIINVLDSFTKFLDSRQDFSYEIIVVDLHSDDTTRRESVQYATLHSQVRVLHVPFRCNMGSGVLIGMMRTRGSHIFIYNIDDGIPVETLSNFERKLETALTRSRQAVVIGNWNPARADTPGTRSSLNIFLDWLLKWSLSWLVKEAHADHARTLLLTREAALTIGPSVNACGETYSIEMIVIASFAKMEMKTVKLDVSDPRRWERPVDSLQRMDDVLVLVQCMFMFWSGRWQVKTIRNQ